MQAGAAVGHGLGEITGLVWAGSLSESDAARLVAQRDAVLSHPDPQRTGMVCVAADASAAEAFCADGELVIAAYNGPRCHVLACRPPQYARSSGGRPAMESRSTFSPPPTDCTPPPWPTG